MVHTFSKFCGLEHESVKSVKMKVETRSENSDNVKRGDSSCFCG